MCFCVNETGHNLRCAMCIQFSVYRKYASISFWLKCFGAMVYLNSVYTQSGLYKVQLKLHNIKSEWTCLNVRKCKSCSFWISNTINAVQGIANMLEIHFLTWMHAIRVHIITEWLGTWMKLLHKTGVRTSAHSKCNAPLWLCVCVCLCFSYHSL